MLTHTIFSPIGINNKISIDYLDSITYDSQKKNIQSSLKYFFGYHVTNKKWEWKYKDSILHIKISDLYKYNSYINRYSEWSYNTKKTKFSHIKSFIRFVINNYAEHFEKLERIELKSDLNGKDLFRFDKKDKHKQPNTSYKRYFMSKKQVIVILEYLYNNKYIYYLMFRLLAESGLRKGELLSINLERNVEGKLINIKKDLANRMIRVMGKTGLLIYPISDDLKNQLLNFLEKHRSKYNIVDGFGKPLFFSQKKNRFNKLALNSMLMGRKDSNYVNKEGKKITIKRQGFLKKIGINQHITPQTFRRSLNELRSLKGCPDKWLAILLNHKISSDSKNSSTNIEYYQNKGFEKVIEMFDKWNPFSNLPHNTHYK